MPLLLQSQQWMGTRGNPSVFQTLLVRQSSLEREPALPVISVLRGESSLLYLFKVCCTPFWFPSFHILYWGLFFSESSASESAEVFNLQETQSQDGLP